MRRRRFLLTCATAPVVAGCMGDSETGEDPSPGNTETDEDSSPANTGTDEGPSIAEDLEEVHGEYRAAWTTFEEEVEKFEDVDDRVSFRTDVIDEHLDRSEAALDRAAEAASVDQRGEIEAFRDVIDWSRSIVSAFENLGNAVDEYATATTYLDNERFEDGADRFSASVDHLDAAESDLTVARDTYDDIDPAAFEDFDEIDALELELLMDDLAALVTDFGTLSRSLRHFSLGFDAFDAAGQAFDDERFGDAVDRFDEAGSEFESANTILEEGEDEASDDFVDDFIGLSCLTGAFRDSAEHFETAAEAADRDDWSRAESEIDAAEEALERCEYEL